MVDFRCVLPMASRTFLSTLFFVYGKRWKTKGKVTILKIWTYLTSLFDIFVASGPQMQYVWHFWLPPYGTLGGTYVKNATKSKIFGHMSESLVRCDKRFFNFVIFRGHIVNIMRCF